MTVYRCSGCGMENRAINELAGVAHARTGRKPSGCAGRWMRLEGAHEEVMLFEETA
jgi:hypothetical protein